MMYLGIDFGTSNSGIAFFDDKRKMLEVVNPEIDKMPGGRVYPSVVAFDREGNMIAAGWYTRSYGQAFPKLVVDQVKRWIGKPYVDAITDPRLRNLGYNIIENEGKALVEVGRRTYTAEEIVTYILKHLVEEARAYLKNKDIDIRREKVTVIVSHPAYYLQNQVEAIRESVNKMKEQVNNIEIGDVKVIPEPVASVCAAMYWGKLSKNDRYVIVIDEGAGTLDTMLVDMQQVNPGEEEEIEARGITIGGHAMLGGSNMDNYIVEWILDELRKDENINRDEIMNINIRELRIEAESAKIDISEGRTKVAQIKVPGFARYFELSESLLDSLVSPVIRDCKKTILESLEEIEKNYKIQRREITKVILVGGPTRMKTFRRMVNDIFKAEIVDINPMECVAVGASVSPDMRYKVPADRTYGLLKKEDKREMLIEVVQKDTPLPKSVVLPWKVEAFEGKIPIEVAQVLEKDNTEIVCMKMGKYEFAASPFEKTYFIVFNLDEERKVEVIVTSSKSRAEDYSQGIIKEIQRGDFRLEFIRDIVPCVLRTTLKDTDQNPLWEVFFKNAPGLYTKLKAADKIVKDCNRIIEFGVEESLLKNLLQEKTDLENILNKIMQDINSGLEQMPKDETVNKETDKVIKQLVDNIVRSDEFLKLSINLDPLERRIDELKDYMVYDKNKIRNLINKISDKKTEASIKMQTFKKILPENTVKEIESLLDELDRIQIFLENKNEIMVNSVDGEMYREGERKEQTLKSIIDQRLVQDK